MSMSMSTASLPEYAAPSPSGGQPYSPLYSAEPHESEQRLLLGRGVPLRAPGEFRRQSRLGGIGIRLAAQESGAVLPVYGTGSRVEGVVEVAKPEGATGVEVKVSGVTCFWDPDLDDTSHCRQIEGRLVLREIAEGGTTAYQLVACRRVLWSRDDPGAGACRASLPFSIELPTAFTDGRDSYPLPPTHRCDLAGVPGFEVSVDYAVSAVVHKAKTPSLLRIGNHAVSTPFVYLPRSRPAVPLPATAPTTPLSALPSEWRCWESVMKAQIPGCSDVTANLYIPASRVFCVSEAVPFHLVFRSSAAALAQLLPFLPTVSFFTTTKQHTRVQVLRQSTVDVRGSVVLGTKTDMWRVDSIGEGSFRRTGDGADFISFVGEIVIDKTVKVGGFKAGGFSVKDCIVLSITPPDFSKAPFGGVRQLVPIRLTTDPWSVCGGAAEYTVGPPTPPEGQLLPDTHHFADYP